MTYGTILFCTNHCHSQLMCCPPNLVDNSTMALPHLHHQMMLMKMEWLELHTLGVMIDTISGKMHLLKNSEEAESAFSEKNLLHKEISCCPHHKITIFNHTDKYLGLNLVVSRHYFCQDEFYHTHRPFFKQKFFWKVASAIMWNSSMHMDILFHIHSSHSICSQQSHQEKLLSMATLDQY